MADGGAGLTTVAVIPARFASTRFPGKPLAKDTGKYLIQHVFDRVAACPLVDQVVVATDDQRIVTAVESFGGAAVMTRRDHRSGTDRTAEVAAAKGLDKDDLVLNVQGDEPEVEGETLARLIQRVTSASESCRIGTLAAPFDDAGPHEGPGSPLDPNCVKVVVDAHGRALYFSRSPIPYPRDTGGVVDRPSRWLLHLGVYAFRADTLREIAAAAMETGPLEQAESLEQLRWMEHGIAIAVERVKRAFVGIDTPEDYAAFVRRSLADRGVGTNV